VSSGRFDNQLGKYDEFKNSLNFTLPSIQSGAPP
jgi:hypothetical protein